MRSLVGMNPHEVLPHGPSKVYLDGFLWHEPESAVVAYYTPKASDTLDHFGVYRGADQIETFGQASVVAMNAFLTCKSREITFSQLYEEFNFVFLHIGSVHCRSFIKTGEPFIVIAFIDEYKFRQMQCSGRLYKVPEGTHLDEVATTFTLSTLRNYNLAPGFGLVSEFNGLVGRGIKKTKLP
jgi:hypothetical protein